MKVVEGGFGKKKEYTTPTELIEELTKHEWSEYSDIVVVMGGSETISVLSNLDAPATNLLMDQAKMNILAAAQMEAGDD